MKYIAYMTVVSFVLLLSVSLNANPGNIVQGQQVVGSALPPLCGTIGEIHAVEFKKNPIVKAMGCDDIKPPPFYWGALKPHLPMAICMKYKGASSSEFVRQTGCKMQVREQYGVLITKKKSSQMKLLKSKEEFRRFFIPIESGPEALSYVTALTTAYPVYEFSEQYFIRAPDENGKYLTKKVKPTEVWEKKDGYHIRLFDHVRCGCHRPELYEIEYVVTIDGYITQKSKKTVWQAARHYNICID